MKRFIAMLLGLLASGLFARCLAAEPSLSESGGGPVSLQIRNKMFGELLRPENANNANGTPLVLYPAQPWKCMTWKMHPLGGAAYQLQNYFTSKTFAAETNAGPVTAVIQIPFAKSPGDRPVWHFVKLPGGAYMISGTKSNQVLTAIKSPTGIKVVIQEWREREEQKWELLPIDPKQLTM